jgi:hypothetical protein
VNVAASWTNALEELDACSDAIEWAKDYPSLKAACTSAGALIAVWPGW